MNSDPFSGMDFCCAAPKPNGHLGKASQGGLRCEENGIFGERIRGNLENKSWFKNQSLGTEKKRLKKAKPGVAFSVLTSNDTKEALVSFDHNSFFFFLVFWCLSFAFEVGFWW